VLDGAAHIVGAPPIPPYVAARCNPDAGTLATSSDSSSPLPHPPSESRFPLPLPLPLPTLPGFHIFALFAYTIFVDAAVDVIVLEVGLGGRLDATNVVPREHVAVCGITTLDFDHVELLGDTLPDIAREKAGIMKPGVPVVTVPQRADASAALAAAAAAIGAPLLLATPASLAARSPVGAPPRLGIDGAHQHINAALAVALVDIFRHQVDAGRLPTLHSHPSRRCVLATAAVSAAADVSPYFDAFGTSAPPLPALASAPQRASTAASLHLPEYDVTAPLSDAELAALARVLFVSRTIMARYYDEGAFAAGAIGL